ncbi:unnamed protein product [Prunus armeniaca]|uniref:SHSP domain-containing protein n=1 Tax=Prunus armeniaca TaxID=36596 RepID=A0A6J5VM35_PRUAR|nr:unnamed protein product [Prunus armeniaca]
MYKKEVEIGSFRKVFRIPDGVVLDRIKAKFKERESTLTIVMPKSEKGIREVGIEEVKDDGVDKGLETQQMAQPAAEEVPEKDGSMGKVEVEFVEAEEKKMEENRQIKGKEVDEEVSKKETVADGVLGKDMSGGKNQEEARASKIQSMQETEKSVSRNREEPKMARIAKIEEADDVEKETVARKELGTEQIVTDYKVPKTEDAKETMKEDTGTQVSQEVAKPSQETQATIHHTEQKGSELPKLEGQVQKQRSPEADQSEKRNAGLEDDIRSRRESSDSSKPAGDTITTQQEAQAQQIETTDGISTEGESSDLEKTPPRLEKSNLLCSPFIIAAIGRGGFELGCRVKSTSALANLAKPFASHKLLASIEFGQFYMPLRLVPEIGLQKLEREKQEEPLGVSTALEASHLDELPTALFTITLIEDKTATDDLQKLCVGKDVFSQRLPVRKTLRERILAVDAESGLFQLLQDVTEDTNFETAEKDRELKYTRVERRREAKGKKASSKEQRTMLNKQGA